MLPESTKNWYIRITSPITRFLTRHRVHPNILTASGFLISCLAAYIIAIGNMRLGGFFILLGGTFDVFDGGVARASGRGSPFGAFFDSCLDRVAEIVISLGLLLYFIEREHEVIVAVILVALGGGLMVSYTRARAEALGIECKIGFFQRAERIVLLGFSMLVGEPVVMVVLWVLAVFSSFTAAQRIYHVYRVTRGSEGDIGKPVL